ncbi:MAG: hypothetical protein ACFFDN_00075 [Candidatus Hodarchaeota archaeon]
MAKKITFHWIITICLIIDKGIDKTIRRLIEEANKVEVDLKDLGNGKYEMGEVRTNKKMELVKHMKEFQNCKLIQNAKTDPNWDYELNAKLCGGDCETCPHYIKDPNKEKSDQLANIIEKLKELNKNTEKPFDEAILLLIEAKKKMDEEPIEQKEFVLWYNNEECPNCGKEPNQEIRACETGYSYCCENCAKEHVNNTYTEGGNEQNG